MATLGGHHLTTKAMRVIRWGFDKASRAVRQRVGQLTEAEAHQVEIKSSPVLARISEKPLTRAQTLRQQQTRSYSTRRVVQQAVRYFTHEAQPASRPLRSSYPQSRTRTVISGLTSRTPFASTLRPNLTGGAIPRSAGGYNLGGGRVNGARYFSHTPAQPAEVIQNVSQAVRAFWLSGQRARFDGYNKQNGVKRFRSVTELQDNARRAVDRSHTHSAGSFVDFRVSPIITAVGPLSNVERSGEYASTTGEPVHASIDNASIMSSLAVDFARAVKDLAAINNDLQSLSKLGNLPLLLLNPSTLRVRFPGCDAETVERLCTELQVTRGVIGQDEDFDLQHGAEMALLFPFAPSHPASQINGHSSGKRLKRDQMTWDDMLSSAHESVLSTTSQDLETMTATRGAFIEGSEDESMLQNPWAATDSPRISDYSSLHLSDDEADTAAMFFQPDYRRYRQSRTDRSHHSGQAEYEGLEGIYRFIEHCDSARR